MTKITNKHWRHPFDFVVEITHKEFVDSNVELWYTRRNKFMVYDKIKHKACRFHSIEEATQARQERLKLYENLPKKKETRADRRKKRKKDME